MRLVGALMLIAAAMTACEDRGLADEDRGLADGEGAVAPSLCDIDLTAEGRLGGSDPVHVADGQVLAVRIDQADQSGEPFKHDYMSYSFIDAEVEVTPARIGKDAEGNPAVVGGFGEFNTVPGTFYQYYRSGFAEQVVIEVPTGRSYKFYDSNQSSGLLGVCDVK